MKPRPLQLWVTVGTELDLTAFDILKGLFRRANRVRNIVVYDHVAVMQYANTCLFLFFLCPSLTQSCCTEF